MRVRKPVSRTDDAVADQSAPQLEIPKITGNEVRSSYGSIPGDEFPGAVYGTVVFAFAWMMLAAWLAFGGPPGTDLDLAIASVLCTVFLGLPFILYRTACNRLQRPHQISKRFLESRIGIATGTLSGANAWLQVILIPVALALAATLIGGVFEFMS